MPLLRKRLNVAGEESSQRYDDELVDAVKAFQKGAALNPDGVIGPGTLRHLNGHVAPKRADNIDTIIVNMERWRWYPRDLGKAHVIVNQPDFTLKVDHDGAPVWTTRVVIGKPSMATPLLSETMKYITINPTWNVPPSIVHNEYLPALAQDPTVLSRMGLQGRQQSRRQRAHLPAAGRGQCARPHPLQLPQPLPGLSARYAGQASVRARRARLQPRLHARAGSGQVRRGAVQHRAAERATGPRSRIKKMFGTAEQDIQLPPRPIWVHLTYQSAFVDDDGKLQIRRDVYNLDGRTLAAIKSERGSRRAAAGAKREGDRIERAERSRRSARQRRRSSSAVRRRRSRPGSGRPQPPRPVPADQTTERWAYRITLGRPVAR